LTHLSVNWLSAANDAGASCEPSRADPAGVVWVFQECLTVQSIYVVVRANPNLAITAAGSQLVSAEDTE
jgi:hypothetical protein